MLIISMHQNVLCCVGYWYDYYSQCRWAMQTRSPSMGKMEMWNCIWRVFNNFPADCFAVPITIRSRSTRWCKITSNKKERKNGSESKQQRTDISWQSYEQTPTIKQRSVWAEMMISDQLVVQTNQLSRWVSMAGKENEQHLFDVT